MADVIIGIDLGTTNSEVAIVLDGKAQIIHVDGDPILPSMVGLSEEGKLLVGKPARNQYVLAPDRTARSIKRLMGQDAKVQLGDQSFRPQEISAIILRRLKEAAEGHLDQPVGKAVITVPAYFNDSQRQATREAGELAGLEVVRILNEPTAAALTYNPDPGQNERFLVYDLGGGTFDVSIVQAEGGVFEVLASHGDTQLGGDDFDELLLDHVAEEFEQLFGVDLRDDRVSRARLLRAVENAKKQLSDHAYARLEEEFIAEKDGVPLHLNIELSRSDFERLIEPLLHRTMDCVGKALDDARLSATDISRVILVGGSTRTPYISRLLEERLGQQAHREVHPDLCVALGAAVQAAIIAGQNVGAVLVDITPHTIGIKCVELPDSFAAHVNAYKFAMIVPRNTPLPATRSEVFCTMTDNQSSVDVDIYQGESGDVRRNHRIGRFLIEGLARVPAGNQIVVELKLTLDGTLQVLAREKATGLVKRVTIENAMARYAVEERDAAQKRLDKLWTDPDWNVLDDSADPAEDRFGKIESPDPYPDRSKEHNHLPEPSEVVPTLHPRFQIPDKTSGSGIPPKTSSPPPSAAAPGSNTDAAEAETRRLLDRAARIRLRVSDEDQAEIDRHVALIEAAIQKSDWSQVRSMSTTLADVLFYLEDA